MDKYSYIDNKAGYLMIWNFVKGSFGSSYSFAQFWKCRRLGNSVVETRPFVGHEGSKHTRSDLVIIITRRLNRDILVLKKTRSNRS